MPCGPCGRPPVDRSDRRCSRGKLTTSPMAILDTVALAFSIANLSSFVAPEVSAEAADPALVPSEAPSVEDSPQEEPQTAVVREPVVVVGPAIDYADAPELRGRADERRRPRARGRLRGYLQRPVPWSARQLDHGVLQVGVAGGVPARYRVDLALGLLDHVTLGVTAHWLSGQKAPQVAPRAALAFYRHRIFELGSTYHQTLHPPPREDSETGERQFEKRTHWVLGHFTMSMSFFSAGFDAGVAHRRVVPSPDPTLAPGVFARRIDVAGGVHLRIGTRRFGFTFQGLVAGLDDTELTVEGLLDLRFGLFELRPRGGWRSW